MTLYETLSIVIAGLALGATIWAHKRINHINLIISQLNLSMTEINLRIRNMQKTSTSGVQSTAISGGGNVTVWQHNTYVDNRVSYDTPSSKGSSATNHDYT